MRRRSSAPAPATTLLRSPSPTGATGPAARWGFGLPASVAAAAGSETQTNFSNDGSSEIEKWAAGPALMPVLRRFALASCPRSCTCLPRQWARQRTQCLCLPVPLHGKQHRFDCQVTVSPSWRHRAGRQSGGSCWRQRLQRRCCSARRLSCTGEWRFEPMAQHACPKPCPQPHAWPLASQGSAATAAQSQGSGCFAGCAVSAGRG